MQLDSDDEILQDFIIEAGELLEQLNEQLVELEQYPDDSDRLNSVFRNFHTIKGGASFLGLTALVEVCHKAEDVFNVLRQGERQVTGALMDVVLRALDVVNGMFAQIHAGQMPENPEPGLIDQLAVYAVPGDEPAAEPVATTQEPNPESVAETAPEPQESGSEEITDDEFEALLDELDAAKPGPDAEPSTVATNPAADDNTISDEEFEALLDDLEAGKAVDANEQKPAEPSEVKPETAPEPAPARVAAAPANSPPAETTVRVDTSRLDEIMNLVGELVLVRNRMETLKEQIGNEEVTKAVANLDLVTADLQTSVMKTRMQPIKKVFGRFPRVIRDLARNLKREVKLEMIGEDTDLDKNLVEALADPLVHLVRNAVDHGIEPPDEREAAGKPRCGTVVLSAQQEGDHILLAIKDDGKGMDAEFLRNKVVEKGLMDAETASRLDDHDAYNLIFMAGFSTKTEVSDVSGRGVGMDVVKTRINQLNGHVEVDSKPGQGSCLTIRVPLTLAIMPTLMVVLGGQTFALPLSGVKEIISLEDTRTSCVDGQLVVRLRDRAMPIFFLRKVMAPQAGEKEDGAGHLIVVQLGVQTIGFVVDELVGQEEVVIKPLGALLQKVPGFAGATITGDGNIALIVDVPSLMKFYANQM